MLPAIRHKIITESELDIKLLALTGSGHRQILIIVWSFFVDHQAPTPPTSAPLTKDKAASIFSYELSDLPQSNDKNNFGNPEYFDTAAADNDEVDDGISSDELEDLETNLCDPLLPHNNKDYYNSVAAFGSDSSARDSFISN